VSERKPWGRFSPCDVHRPELGCPQSCLGRRYRYELWWPTGLDNDRKCVGIFANPSTATPEELDPTLTRWRNYCRDWGFGWSGTLNVRAWRETNPKLVPCDALAVGPSNDLNLQQVLADPAVELVVCGWGELGGDRGRVVLDIIRAAGRVPHALKLTKGGNPGHPLYLPKSANPFPMPEAV
jgi:hypothetical protein